MNKTMKAVIKSKEGVGAELVDLPIPEISADEVLISVKATAVCGTDVHIYNWNSWAQGAGINLPLTLGHEFCGEVVEIGANVKGLKVGDIVAGETHIPCGTCYQCLNGQQHICGNLTIFGVHTDGCFAEYTKIPAYCARKLPEAIPAKYGAVLEPLGTSIRACTEAQVGGKRVAVIGCGAIGLFAVSAAAALGAKEVIAVDVFDEKLEVAKTVGSTHQVNSMTVDATKTILELTDGVGVDVIIEASGHSGAIQQGFKFLRKGGEVMLIGLPSTPVPLDFGPDVVFKEATIKGIHGREMYKTWLIMENLIASNKMKIDPIITHQMALDKFDYAFELLKGNTGIKIVLIP